MKPLYHLVLLALPMMATGQTISRFEASKPARSVPLYRPGHARPGFILLVSAGSTGGSVALGYSVSRQLALRVGANLYHYNGTLKSGNDADNIQIEFDYQIKLENADLKIDLYPFNRSGFRLTSGVYYNKNALTFLGKPAKNVKFNDTVFTIDQVGTLAGQANFNKFAPYAGLGFGNPYTRKRLTLMLDVGFFYQQSPLISLQATGLLEPSADQGAVIQRNLQPLQYYPVVNLGLAYKL